MKGQKSFSLVLLLAEVAFTLFISGSSCRVSSDLIWPRKRLWLWDLSVHSTSQGLRSRTRPKTSHWQILGGLVGTMAAFAIHFHATTPGNRPSTRTTTLQTAHHASPLTGLAETVNRDSASVGHRVHLPRLLRICLNLKTWSYIQSTISYRRCWVRRYE